MWNPSQRAVVLAIVLAIFLYLCIRFSLQHTYIGDPQPLDGSRAAELADRLDPNTATIAEIAAIPTIGEKLGAAIVAYREQYAKDHPGQVAFNEPRDLLKVRGVGAARMETLQAYMEFPGKAAKPAQQNGEGN